MSEQLDEDVVSMTAMMHGGEAERTLLTRLYYHHAH